MPKVIQSTKKKTKKRKEYVSEDRYYPLTKFEKEYMRMYPEKCK